MNLFNTLWLPRKRLARGRFSRAPPKFASVSHSTELPFRSHEKIAGYLVDQVRRFCLVEASAMVLDWMQGQGPRVRVQDQVQGRKDQGSSAMVLDRMGQGQGPRVRVQDQVQGRIKA